MRIGRAQRERETDEASVALGAQSPPQLRRAEHADAGRHRQDRDDEGGRDVRDGQAAQRGPKPRRDRDRRQQQQWFGEAPDVKAHPRHLRAQRRVDEHQRRRRQQHSRSHDRQRRRKARFVPRTRDRLRQQRQSDREDRRDRDRQTDAGAERACFEVSLARGAMRGDEAMHAAHRPGLARPDQNVEDRDARLVGAEYSHTEQPRDEDVRDRHQALTDRRQQLEHAAAGDVARVVGSVARWRWRRSGLRLRHLGGANTSKDGTADSAGGQRCCRPALACMRRGPLFY